MGTHSLWRFAGLMVMVIGGVAACTYGNIPPAATIGEKMVISCNLDRRCFEGVYKWYLINNTLNVTLPETSSKLVVSENVTSAAEVGGRLYECHCPSVADCRSFRIGVKPIAHLYISNEVAKSGRGVNITCTAESYPPAQSTDDYKMKHPRNTPISQKLLPAKNGVVHTITAASKETDAGVYQCAVSVTLEEYPNQSLQSKNDIAILTVYDPPSIKRVHNSTIGMDVGVEQSIFLECAVSNTENDLEVWVNWTTADGQAIKKKHLALRKADVFFLLLYNVSADDYMCRVYSSYSPDKPEDQGAVAVMIAELPTIGTGGLAPKQEESNNLVWGISAVLAAIIVFFLTTTVILSVLLFQQCKNNKSKAPTSVAFCNCGQSNNVCVTGHRDPPPSHSGPGIQITDGVPLDEEAVTCATKTDVLERPLEREERYVDISPRRKKAHSETKPVSIPTKLPTNSPPCIHNSDEVTPSIQDKVSVSDATAIGVSETVEASKLVEREVVSPSRNKTHSERKPVFAPTKSLPPISSFPRSSRHNRDLRFSGAYRKSSAPTEEYQGLVPSDSIVRQTEQSDTKSTPPSSPNPGVLMADGFSLSIRNEGAVTHATTDGVSEEESEGARLEDQDVASHMATEMIPAHALTSAVFSNTPPHSHSSPPRSPSNKKESLVRRLSVTLRRPSATTEEAQSLLPSKLAEVVHKADSQDSGDETT